MNALATIERCQHGENADACAKCKANVAEYERLNSTAKAPPRGSWKKETWRGTEPTSKFWADKGWFRVELDPKPPGVTAGCFPPDELEPINASKRECAPAQASLFGGA